MRDVLYRAKPLNLDAYSDHIREGISWVYGCPLVNPFHPNPFNGLSVQIFERRDGKMFNWECDPETLGQWTGLTDKNGKKVFEDDIVKMRNEFDDEWCAVVKFGQRPRNNNWGWKLTPIEKVFFDTSILLWVGMGDTTGVVIGNIHDNPDILER